MLESDTTSAVFSQGKTSMMKKNRSARDAAKILLKSDASVSEVGEAGIKHGVLI